MGLHRAGFEVVGVDIKPQKNYPFQFHRHDALTFPLEGYDLIWASPPCQAFSNARVIHGKEHPDLLTPMRTRLQFDAGCVWVIENVPGAPMRKDLILCGSMFGESRLRRHRWFECDEPRLMPIGPCQHGNGETVRVFGHGGDVYNTVDTWREVMGIDWMNRAELAQAIPPAYSEFIGKQLIRAMV